MSTHLYFAVFRAEPDGGYSVGFPDVPGAISEGDSFAEALQNAKDALESALDFLTAEGLPLPHSRAPEAILAEANGAPIAAIEAETATASVRVNVSFDERLLARIDRAAESSGHTRSGFLARAARELIASSKTTGAALRVVSKDGDASGLAAALLPQTTFSAAAGLSRNLEQISACLRLDPPVSRTTVSAPIPLQGFGDEMCGPFYMLRSTAETLFAFGPAGPNSGYSYEDDAEELQHS